MTKREIISKILFGSEHNAAHLSALARACGVSYSTMYRWKENPYLIPLGKLLRIAHLRGVHLEELEK